MLGVFRVLIFLSACFFALGSTAQIKIVENPDTVLIADHFQLTYEIDNKDRRIESVQWNTDFFVEDEDIVLIESSASEDELKFRKTLTLAIFDTGLVNLPVVATETVLVDGQISMQVSDELRVRIVLPKDLKGELQPIKDIIEDPAPSFLWLYFTIALLVLLLLVLIWLVVRRRKKSQLPLEPKPDYSAINPEEWAIRQIQELRKNTVDDPEDEEAYFTRLSYIFRNWMKNRFGFKAIEMTGSELMEELDEREICDPTTLLDIKSMIGKIEQIKYAKGKPDEGFRELSTSYIESLIIKHKQELENQKEGEDV
ncbi:MAG: hypothetical protein EA362_07790 [Saprospirales bacterium]|nr:MAG: hypothetical protein EA362_07790 [Saprospirales bacterium]